MSTSTGKKLPEITPEEARLMEAILKYGGKVETDWEKVCESTGYKNVNSVKTRFAQIKSKRWGSAAREAAGKSKAAEDPAPKQTKKRKVGIVTEEEGDSAAKSESGKKKKKPNTAHGIKKEIKNDE